MGKYTEEQKLAVVVDYCSGSDGMKAVALRHGVDFTSLRHWAARYREHGAAGVKAKPRQRYSAEFKLAVVLCKRADHLSNRQAAALFNVPRFNIISDWERAYDTDGVDALEPYHNARPKRTMKKLLVEQPLESPDIVSALK